MRKIETSEVKRILEMHSKLKKKPILEQNTPVQNTPNVNPTVNQDEVDLKLIRDAITAKCLKNGKAQYLRGTKKPVYVVTTAKSGKVVVFYPDMTYKFADGSKSGKWKCDGLTTLANTAAQQATQQAANTEDIKRVKAEGKWLEASETNTTRENLENPKMYEKKVVSGVTLYRPVISSGVASGLTDEQKKVIEKYTNLGGKLRKDLDAEEAQTWTSKVVYPAGSLFSQDLVMYFPPKNITGAEGGNIETQFNNAVTNQTPTSKKDCKNTIEAWYNAWKTKKRIEPNTFIPMKEKVQACANQFDGKWGGIFSSVDNYVETLRGGSGGPLSYGEDSKWRLK
jgi:hypothetical protein